MIGWECPIKPREASGLDPEAVHVLGEISLGKAADLTGVTRWEMEEILQEAGVKLRLGPQTKDDLAMQQAIGHPTRFRILRTLVANDELSASDLKAAVDVGLVDKRQRRTADSQGFYTYYRPTGMGQGILEHGVEELMRREREFNNVYS